MGWSLTSSDPGHDNAGKDRCQQSYHFMTMTSPKHKEIWIMYQKMFFATILLYCYPVTDVHNNVSRILIKNEQ
jgi:hypothetical protein